DVCSSDLPALRGKSAQRPLRAVLSRASPCESPSPLPAVPAVGVWLATPPPSPRDRFFQEGDTVRAAVPPRAGLCLLRARGRGPRSSRVRPRSAARGYSLATGKRPTVSWTRQQCPRRRPPNGE